MVQLSCFFSYASGQLQRQGHVMLKLGLRILCGISNLSSQLLRLLAVCRLAVPSFAAAWRLVAGLLGRQLSLLGGGAEV